MLNSLKNWQQTQGTLKYFFETFDPMLRNPLFKNATFPTEGISGGKSDIAKAGITQLGLGDFFWSNGQLVEADPSFTKDNPASLSGGEEIFKNLEPYFEAARKTQALEASIEEIYPAKRWTEQEAESLMQHLLTVFATVRAATEKGKNCTLMVSSFLGVMSPLLALWDQKNPDLQLENSSIWSSIATVRYLRDRLVKTGTVSTGQLLWAQDALTDEGQKLTLQSSGMQLETGSKMTPEQLCTHVNDFSKRVTKGMVPEAVKLEQLQGIDLLLAASEYRVFEPNDCS